MNEWISVKKRKPKRGQHVLAVQDPTKSATREALFAIYNGKRFMPPERYENPIDEFGGTCLGWSEIIYWMPLPEPPKQ